ncbi:MAG TPA: TonB-dependent receptor [Pyrinomonadaceae bacterium]|jgi:hypothetical protein
MTALLLLALASLSAFAQGASSGSLAGTVTDPSGAVVANASVVVRSNATNQEFTAQTADNGTFNVPSLASGMYTVTVTAQGFKQAVVQNVKVDVGTPSSINLALEVGAVNDTVTITAAGGELLQTQTATVGTTITGRQIVEQPQSSRDALDLVTLLPGVQSTGRPRQSSVNGLPKGALNITIDGVNVQDNLIKSQDGFFTYVRPRIDAIDEVTVSTATPGAESAAEGAVQIKFITRSGTNDLRGSLYWYHREPTLSANYWFQNLQPADPRTGKAPRLRVLLNQFGGRAGGPIMIPKVFDGRNKAFFFVNYEEYHLPEQQLRNRNIFNANIFGGATPGNFQYTTASGTTNTVNLLAVAGARGLTNTVDPTIGGLLGAIRGTTAQGSLRAITGQPNFQQFSFVATNLQNRKFPTVRLDYNITKNHHIENIWNYQQFRSPIDFLNNLDPSFPGFTNTAGQNSNRFSNTTALRSTLTASLVNEARLGFAGGNSFSVVGRDQFANQGGFDLAFSDSVNQSVVLSDVTANNFPNQGALGLFGNQSSRRNTPYTTFTDNLTWVKGKHTFNFGGDYTTVKSFQINTPEVAPTAFFGIAGGDPAEDLFFDPATAASIFPGASDVQLNEAAQIYALLTGRLVNITQNAYLNEDGKYNLLGAQTTRFKQKQYGLYVQDSWRFRPNLTLNYGLRWEPQEAPVSQNNVYAKTDVAGVFGVSGTGRLFQPGVQPGARPAQYTALRPGEQLYKTDWNNLAPSAGIAYQPEFKSHLLGRLFGQPGQSVLRAGYSIAYVREGLSLVIQPVQGHPGGLAPVILNAGSDFAPGTLFRNRASLVLPSFPASPTYPITGTFSDFATPSAFDPNLKTGYVQSWTAGFQRELTRDTVFEARYVGTRGIKLARRYNINEVNTIENGFATEFALAQRNLIANRAAGRGNNFRYFGPGTNTNPLPILYSFFTGQNGANASACGGAGQPTCASVYSSSSFANATFITNLLPNNNNVVGFANTLSAGGGVSPTTGDFYFNNGIASGLPANFFVANPDAILAGAALTDNGQKTWYDGLTLEVRRRMSQGLLLQANYTFSKSFTNFFASSQTNLNSYVTLRDFSLSKRYSPYDQRHAFKVNWIYELPVGRGKLIGGESNGLVDRLIGGWEVHGTARVQSGRAFRLGNVQLVGMTAQDLQHAIEIRKDPSGIVFFLPDDIITNTRRAFTFSSASNATTIATGGYATPPTGRFIAPPGYGGCVQRYVGQCGFSDLVLHGPRFVRVDMSVVKKIKFTERTNLELRGEFLNAINNQNFFVGGSASVDAAAVTNFGAGAFGQTNTAYQDISTTNDPGGRQVQFVIRFNF